MTRGRAHHIPAPAQVARSLVSMGFPCQKDELIRHAEAHQADEAVLTILKAMPERTYGSMADVIQGYEQTVGGTDAQGPGASTRGRAITAQRRKTTAHEQGVTVRGQTKDDTAEFAEENATLDKAGVPTRP